MRYVQIGSLKMPLATQPEPVKPKRAKKVKDAEPSASVEVTEPEVSDE